MECRISSLLHLKLMIYHKYIQLIKNILLEKTWSMCIFELPNIIFNPMISCFGCARQNVADKMEIIARFLPHCHHPRRPSSCLARQSKAKTKNLKISFYLTTKSPGSYFQFVTMKYEKNLNPNPNVNRVFFGCLVADFPFQFPFYYSQLIA